MTDNVVAINAHAELLNQTVVFAEWLLAEIRANRISAMCVRGVDKEGETFAFDIIPVNAPTLRYQMIGLLHEATLEAVADGD